MSRSAVIPGFEAKKHAYRQTQDGVVVSFVVDPQDVPDRLALDALGTRYFVALADAEHMESQAHYEDGTESVKPGSRRDFHTLPPTQQAVLKCKDPEFRLFLGDHVKADIDDEETAARAVRLLCGVDSRAELNDRPEIWRELMRRFVSWQQHSGRLPASSGGAQRAARSPPAGTGPSAQGGPAPDPSPVPPAKADRRRVTP